MNKLIFDQMKSTLLRIFERIKQGEASQIDSLKNKKP
jgi:hypothetical protein